MTGRDDQLARAAKLTSCRACGAPIRFVRLDTGRALPVNPVPNPRGNVSAHIAGGRLHGFVISRDKQPGPLDSYRMVPHHATCEERTRPESKPKPEPDPALF